MKLLQSMKPLKEWFHEWYEAATKEEILLATGEHLPQTKEHV